ncbi:20769_t:CDS:2, partial [Rhizophagus irregularis]
ILSIQVHGLCKKFKVQEQLSTTLSVENLLAEITRVYQEKLMLLLSHYELTKRDADNLDERSCVLIRVIMLYKDYYGCINPFF